MFAQERKKLLTDIVNILLSSNHFLQYLENTPIH